ncbi:hypothetical protein ACOSQ4_027629 [Xanthoceras sorbifolium]
MFSRFSLHQSSELVFQPISSGLYEENIILAGPNLTSSAHYSSMDDHAANNLINNSSDRNSQWRKKLRVSDRSENTSDDANKKMIAHKDIEKQRRQEMATLHASLRSLLPLEYIKGKRSMSDHMNGAVYYINDLKNKIKELSDRRDELKRLSNSSGSGGRQESGSRSEPASCVMIHPCLGGLEIVISSSFREQIFLLSTVFEILLKEGLDVISSLSTKVNEKLLLTIHTKVSDLTYIDMSRLHQKLMEVSTPSPSIYQATT